MSGAAISLPSLDPAMPREGSLQDRVIIVTGGTRGIGRAIVEALARQGATICFTYAQRRELAEGAVRALEAQDRRALAVQADVRDFTQAQAVVAQTLERFGRLDGLVNNAGITRDAALMLMDPDEWQEVIETNLTGVFNYCRAAIVTFLKQRAGRIVNITSVSGLAGMAGQVNYSASKAGVIGLTKALAKEVARYGIVVNAIAPGYIETDMTRSLEGPRKAALQERIPLGRFGTAEEIAGLVAVLMGDRASYMTGQVLTVDGGLIL